MDEIIVSQISRFVPVLIAAGNKTFVEFFAQDLRSNLFGGFLTLAAFLFSVRTFLTIHLQKEIYGQESYHKRISELREYNKRLTVYGPLRRLDKCLAITTLLSVVASVLQLTLGLVPAIWAVVVCIVAAVVALTSLVISLFVVHIAMQDWFETLEERAEEPSSNGKDQSSK